MLHFLARRSDRRRAVHAQGVDKARGRAEEAAADELEQGADVGRHLRLGQRHAQLREERRQVCVHVADNLEISYIWDTQ